MTSTAPTADRRNRARDLDRERGSVAVWMITTALALVLIAGIAIDLTGQVHASQYVQDVAAQAARAGGQQLRAAPAIHGAGTTIDEAAAAQAAATFIAAAPDVTGAAHVTPDGRVVVDTSGDYSTKFLTIIGVRQLTVTGHAEVLANRVVEGAIR